MENSIHGIEIEHADESIVHSFSAAHNDNTLREYIDFTSGIFAAGFGMADPLVAEYVSTQARHCMHSYTFDTQIKKSYLIALTEFTGFESAYMFSSGTEAVEAALKIARMITKKEGIWGLSNSFHGKTMGAQIAAGRLPDWRNSAPGEKTGCLIFEPYQAMTAQFHSKEMIDRINHLVEKFNLILIADEIQAGFYRTGEMFGFQHYPEIKPDIVCVGKQMTNGFPASAILGPSEWIDNPLMDLSSTNGGNPLACAAGLAVLHHLQTPGQINHINKQSKSFFKNLNLLKQPVQGRGLVASIWFDSVEKADNAVIDLAAAGLLVVHTKGQAIKLAPNLNVSRKVLRAGLDILAEVLG